MLIRFFSITVVMVMLLGFSPGMISVTQAETPLIESSNAEVTASGINPICLLCSVSDVENLVNDNLLTQATMSLPVGVGGSTYACVGANRTIPAGRRAGYVVNLNDGVASLLEGSNIYTRLNGTVQESFSGPGFLLTLIGIGGARNVAASFSQPFDEICYQASAVLSVLSIYRLHYAFVLEAWPGNSVISAQPETITANGTATSIITVQVRDSLDEPVPGGGDDVQLSTTAGNLSAVTDNGDGSYTATLTSSTTPETADITGTINGEVIGHPVSVDFVVDQGSEPDAAMSLLSAHPELIMANGMDSSIVTVQARDAFGNDMSTGGATVTIFTSHGNVGPAIDNGDGSYTAAVVANTPGVAEISGTLNGEAIGQTDTVTFYDPDLADPDTSELHAYPLTITANGTSQALITLNAHNAAGDPVNIGGADIVLTSTAGTLSTTVNDHGDGTYSATLTSSVIEETALVTATLDGQPMNDSASVEFVSDSGGGADAAATRLSAMPTAIEADGLSSSLITVEARDSWGNPLGNGGDSVVLSSTSGHLSAISDLGDGRYTAALFSPVMAGASTITGMINGEPIGQSATVIFLDGIEADAGQSTISANPNQLPADGSSTSTITIDIHDSAGNPVTVGGDAVTIETTLGTLGTTVTDHGDGTYSAELTAPTEPGTAIVSGTINGVPIGMSTEITVYDPTQADPGTSLIEAMPGQITANGSAQAVITIHARNAAGQPTGIGGDSIVVASTAGSLENSVSDHGDGHYTTILTSSMLEESAHITATLNGQPMSASASVDFVAGSGGDAHPDTSWLWAEPTAVMSDGIDEAVVFVQTRDAWGNPVDSGGDSVMLSATLGIPGAVVDHGNGLYSASLSSNVAGFSVVSGTLNGEVMAQMAVVEFTSTVHADASQSTISVHPSQLPPDGTSTALVTVQVNDSSGNPIPVGGDAVTIETTLGTLGTTATDHGDGSYSAVLTAPAEPGTAIISGTINGVPISMTVEIHFADTVDAVFSDRFEE